MKYTKKYSECNQIEAGQIALQLVQNGKDCEVVQTSANKYTVFYNTDY